MHKDISLAIRDGESRRIFASYGPLEYKSMSALTIIERQALLGTKVAPRIYVLRLCLGTFIFLRRNHHVNHTNQTY